MARTKKTHTIEQPPEVNMEAVQEAREAERELQQMQAGYTDERDLMNQLLGQVQMARSLSKFADVVSLSKLAHIKETKMYQALKGKKAIDQHGEEIADVGSWDGFCRMIGATRSKVDEDLTNLRVFGEEALQGLQRIGASYQDLRKLRKLSDDDQRLIIGEVEANAGDREAIVALIDDLVSKHTKEKIALEQEVQNLREDAEAHERLIENKNRKIDDLDRALHRREHLAGAELDAELSRELEDETLAVIGSIMGLERALSQIADHDSAPQQLRDACAYAMRRILTRLQELESAYNIVAVGPADDSWMDQVPGLAQAQAI